MSVLMVTFVVPCPCCHEELPLPEVSLTPVLEMSAVENRVSVRVGDIPSVAHTCTGLPQ